MVRPIVSHSVKFWPKAAMILIITDTTTDIKLTPTERHSGYGGLEGLCLEFSNVPDKSPDTWDSWYVILCECVQTARLISDTLRQNSRGLPHFYISCI